MIRLHLATLSRGLILFLLYYSLLLLYYVLLDNPSDFVNEHFPVVLDYHATA